MRFLLVLFLPVFYFLNPVTEEKPVFLLQQMQDSIKKVRTLKMKIAALERIDKSFVSARSEIKLQQSPHRLYFVNKEKKLEILFDATLDKEKALVKPHVFPYVSMWLDPRGGLMRKNQHYTINELGFSFIGNAILLTLRKDPEGIKNFKYHGKVVKNGSSCYLLEYENKEYSYTDYVVGEHETATTIAYKLIVNDYLLRYRNNLLNDFGFIKKGTILKVPTLYCKKAVIWLEEKRMLPISISLYDDTGFFESYEFTDVQVNPTLTDMDFSKKNPDYHF